MLQMTIANISRLIGLCYQSTSIYLSRAEFQKKYNNKTKKFNVDDDFLNDLEEIITRISGIEYKIERNKKWKNAQ